MSFLSFSVTLVILSVNIYSAQAAGLSFGFSDGEGVKTGMIVSVSKDNTDVLEPAHVNNSSYVVGVAVDKQSSSVVFDNNDSVYVANDGTVDVFVGDLGGDIVSGDLVTVSTIGGVGRKADAIGTTTQKIIGVAKSDFTGEEADAREFNLENSGKVHIGSIQMELLDDLSGIQPEIPSTLENLGTKIAGKDVSFTQSFVSAIVAVLGFVVSGILMFGAIRGSFLSIGRNPLSAKTIYSGMIRASLLSLSVMMLGVVAGYVVLLA